MRKALVIAILALFGSETLAQHGFRPLTRPGNPPPFHPTSGRPVLLDSEDNEMFRVERPIGGTPPFNPFGTPPFNPNGPLINRPILTNQFDETEDNEMFRLERPIGGTPPFNPNGPLINRPIPRNTFDDVEDNEMALDLRLPKEPNYRIKFAEDDDEFFGVPMGNGGSGLYASGGSARGGVAWGAVGQYSHQVAKNTNVFAGAQVSHAPGSKVNIAPHVGVKVRFDDAENDELFAEVAQDDELFGVPMGNGGSGLYASGGSARGGGVAWGAVGQYSHQVAKNTNVFAGAQVSHAPGSKVNIAPHVGVQVRFDDAENDELFAEVPQDDELYAEDDEFFGVPMGNGGSGLYASGGSARGGVAWGGVGQYSHPVAKNTNVFVGASVSHAPGSKVNIAPHAGVQFRFDDEQN